MFPALRSVSGCLNKLMNSNRRYLFPLGRKRRFGRASNAMALLPAAVAYHFRWAKTCN